MTKKPINVATYVKQALSLSDKSQKDIAREVGFNQPNNISMIKEGITKLPINRVPALAKSLGVDPIHLLRIAMQEYMPETWEVIEKLLGGSLISEQEKTMLSIVRKATRNVEIDFDDPKLIAAVNKALEPFVDAELEDRAGASRSAEKRKTRAA